MKAAHLHLGAGALGLGLIIPAMKKTGKKTEIFIANRESTSSNSNARNKILSNEKSYSLRNKEKLEKIEFDDFLMYDDKKIVDLAAESRALFVTTALKETGLRDSLDVIAKIIYHRSNAKHDLPLFFIACENAVKSSEIKEDVRKRIIAGFGLTNSFSFDNNIFFLDCVVDRICATLPIQDSKNVEIYAEKYASWIIDKKEFGVDFERNPHYLYFENNLRSLSDIIELVDDIEFYTRRKKWLVNSIHQLTAIAAFVYKEYHIDTFLKTRIGSDLLKSIIAEILVLYTKQENNLKYSDLMKYVATIYDRLENEYSDVNSALSRFTSKERLPEFFKDYFRKVGEITLHHYNSNSGSLFWIPFLLFKIIESISNDEYIK